MHNQNTRLRLAGHILAVSTVLFAIQTPAGPPPAAATNTAASASAGAPKIQFATTRFDFGRVKAGDPVKATFVLTNTGTAPLDITNVRPGCGCTTAGTWDHQVEPGKTTTIPLQLNTSHFSGHIIKNATVTCNDPATRTVMLLIQGEVWRPLEVQPSMVIFNLRTGDDSTAVRTVRVINHTDGNMTLGEPTCDHECFKIAKKVIRPGKEFEIQVTAVPPLARGSTMGRVTIPNSLTNEPAITFNVLATVQPTLVVTPGQVVLPTGPLRQPTQVTVSVRNTRPESITVSDPSLSISNATVAITPVQPGRMYNLALHFPAGFELKSGEHAQLALKTSDPKTPLLQVPILMRAMARPLPKLAVPH